MQTESRLLYKVLDDSPVTVRNADRTSVVTAASHRCSQGTCKRTNYTSDKEPAGTSTPPMLSARTWHMTKAYMLTGKTLDIACRCGSWPAFHRADSTLLKGSSTASGAAAAAHRRPSIPALMLLTCTCSYHKSSPSPTTEQLQPQNLVCSAGAKHALGVCRCAATALTSTPSSSKCT
jgi:hypothetical protein